MSLVYVAELPVPLLSPSVYAALGCSIGFDADLTGSLSLTASLTITPPTVAVYLAALVEQQAKLDLAIGLGLPSASFSLQTVLDVQVSLELALSLLLALNATLNASIGLYAGTYAGPGSGLGAALTTALGSTWPDGSPSAGACNGIVFGAVSTVAQANIQAWLNGLKVGSGLVWAAKLSALAALSLTTSDAMTQASAAISAKLSATLAAKVAIGLKLSPPTLAVTAVALATFAANLAASAKLAPPSVSAAVSATAKLSASISAQFGLMAKLGACLRWDAGMFCYTYTGPGSGLGAALTTALGSTWGDGVTPSTGECLAVVLAVTDSASWDVLGMFFGGL